MIAKFFSLTSRLWVANLLNITGLGTQLWKMIETHKADGVSYVSFLMFAFIQVTLAENAYRNKEQSTLIGMAICCAISLAIASLAFAWQ